MIRLLVACEDAGGARSVLPAIAAIQQRGDEVSFLCGPVAARCFVDAGIDVTPVDDDAAVAAAVAGLFAQPWSALLTASTCWGLRLEARSVIAARDRGVPSLTIIDFAARLVERLSYPGTADLRALPDRIAATDAFMQHQLVDAGITRERIVTTGSPALDPHFAMPSPPSPRESREVLFLSQPLQELFGEDPSRDGHPGYTERTVLALVAATVRDLGATLTIRPHPRENEVELRRFAATLPCASHVRADGTLADAIAHGPVVVGMMTMALAEAALLGATVLSVQPDLRGADTLLSNRVGLTTPVTEAAQVPAALRHALHHRRSRRELLRAAAELGWRPGATGRLVAAIDELVTSFPGT